MIFGGYTKTRIALFLYTVWKKVVEKVDVNVFSAAKVKSTSLLFPHLATLKISKIFLKLLLLKILSTIKRIKCKREF